MNQQNVAVKTSIVIITNTFLTPSPPKEERAFSVAPWILPEVCGHLTRSMALDNGFQVHDPPPSVLHGKLLFASRPHLEEELQVSNIPASL